MSQFVSNFKWVPGANKNASTWAFPWRDPRTLETPRQDLQETDHFKDKPDIMRATSISFLVESIVLGASGLVHGNPNILVCRLPVTQVSKGTRILTVLEHPCGKRARPPSGRALNPLSTAPPEPNSMLTVQRTEDRGS